MRSTPAGAPRELLLVLFPEAVTDREEVPAPLLVHVPHVRLLASVFSLILIDQVHQEEPVRQTYRRYQMHRERVRQTNNCQMHYEEPVRQTSDNCQVHQKETERHTIFLI